MAADGSVVFSVSADDADAQKKLAELRRDIEKTTKSLNENTGKRSALLEQLQEAREEVIRIQKEIETLNSERLETKNVLTGMEENGEKGSEDYIAAQQVLKEQEYNLAQQVKLREKQEAVVERLEGKEQALADTMAQQTGQLETMQSDAGAIESTYAKTATSTLPSLGDAVNQVSTSIRKASKNILRWGFGIRSTFILVRRLRSAIKEGIKTFAEYDEETKTNITSLKNSLSTLKAAWGAAFSPIVNSVTPMLQTLIEWLIKAANYVNMFFSALNGSSSYKKIINNNEDLSDSYDSTGSSADSAAKSVMGFDELNKLDSSSGGGSGSSSSKTFDVETADVSATMTKFIEDIKTNLAALELALGEFLFGIGAILTFSGANIALGLAMMVLGGYLIVQSVKKNWGGVNQTLISVISELMVILGTLLFAIGAVIAFSCPTHLGLGIGMMIAGAAMVTAVAIKWNSLPEKVQRVLTVLMIALGSALLVLGFILLFNPATIGMGIAMLAAGGLMLGFGLTKVDWNEISTKIKGVKDKIVGYVNNLKSKWDEMIDKATEMKNKVVQKFIDIKTSISTTINNIKNKIGEAIDKIKEFFNFEWSIPTIKLPHIQVSWEGLSADNPISKLLGIGSIPHFSVQWYAKGGIIDGATLLGAGEAGKEAIVPLERNMEWVNTVANGIADALTGNNRFADAITDAILPSFASGQIVPPRALSNGGSVFSDGDIDRLANAIASAFTFSGTDDHVTKLYLDGRELATCVTKHQRQMARGTA